MRVARIALILALAFHSGALAAVAAAGSVPCGRLLTASELASAAGPGFQSLSQEEPAPGRSECAWLLDVKPDPKAVLLTFTERSAASGGLDAFFEAQARHAESLHENPREALSGVGVRAALVPGKKPSAMAILVVQTTEGLAYVETDYLDRAQLLRLARAIAEP